MMHNSFLSNRILAPEDLALLQMFLEAWCVENSVDIRDASAQEVAIGLIDWYQNDDSDKSQLKAHIEDAAALSPDLQRLVDRLS